MADPRGRAVYRQGSGEKAGAGENQRGAAAEGKHAGGSWVDRPLVATPARTVHSSSSRAGRIAALESGIAVAVLTKCSVPEGLDILGSGHAMGPMQVAVHSIKPSRSDKALDMHHGLLLWALQSASSGELGSVPPNQ